MKMIKIILTIIIILFVVLRVFRVLPFNITNPVMFTSLATLLLLRSIEYKKAEIKKDFFLHLSVRYLFISLSFSAFVPCFLDMRKWILETA